MPFELEQALKQFSELSLNVFLGNMAEFSLSQSQR